jgi:hypothetical protein
MPVRECDPVEQTLRQVLLEELYRMDGRSEPDHPMYGLYTGLVYTPEEQ